jgi:hypothetical protein
MVVLNDEPLSCPQCAYDLRASDGPHCPECGTGFDPQRLRESWEVRKRGTPWERKPSIVSFFATWLAVVFRPLRFARCFPNRPDSLPATQFTLVCYAIGTALIIVGGLATHADWIGPLAAFGGLAGVTICEFALAGMLALLGPPTHAPRTGGAYRFWRGVCHYTGAFTIVSAAWGAIELSNHARPKTNPDDLLWLIAPSAIFLWWWVNLAITVIVRARGTTRKAIGVLLIPIVGGLSIGIGYGAAVIAAFASPF